MSLPDEAEIWWNLKGWNSDGTRMKKRARPLPPPIHYDDTGKGDHYCRTGQDTDPVRCVRPRGAFRHGVSCPRCIEAVRRFNLNCKDVRRWAETFPLRSEKPKPSAE